MSHTLSGSSVAQGQQQQPPPPQQLLAPVDSNQLHPPLAATELLQYSQPLLLVVMGSHRFPPPLALLSELPRVIRCRLLLDILVLPLALQWSWRKVRPIDMMKIWPFQPLLSMTEMIQPPIETI
jgi:hypothetical protein